ncbi:MAG: C1 family peptidase, partial [Sandaracinaceae bacterium]|nr:C1 family peptidase [Sandaracinaceae bacterium]
MRVGSSLGRFVGLSFGQYLGRQIALGACREDRDDDWDRRPFTPRMPSHALPLAVDLRRWMTRVEEQGRMGSCAANALVGAVEYLVHREHGRAVDLSRLFVYFCQRLWDDCVRDDAGASIADGVRALATLGVPLEASWPYDPRLFAVQPPESVLVEAQRIRATDWWSVPVDGEAFRGCLAAGFPIVIGTKVTQSFVQTPRTGLTGMPQGQDDRRHGRHALLLVGYDDARKLFCARNSWGDDWGDLGYCYMPYDYVLNRSWTRGCWAIRLTHAE